MTHRMFSRNAMSSRAIPVAKMIEQVRTNPAKPIHWGANQRGMQAASEVTDTTEAQQLWITAAKRAADMAEEMDALGLHKQVVNRILEPFQWMHTVVTATEWDNFFLLRAHPDAQPEFQQLAFAMRDAMAESKPVNRGRPGYSSDPMSWHLPYVYPGERDYYLVSVLPKLSAARCARVSYLTHDGEKPRVDNDLELFQRLVGSDPQHASPVEHQAYPAPTKDESSGNFKGWVQYRQVWGNK
jgi:thymidylate synthase ThyX